MPFSFPASPTVGDQSTQNGRVYSWTGSAWEIVPIPTAVDAGNLTGTVATARIPSLPASQIGSGVLDAARLGSGATSTNFLRGDSTYADPVTYATTAQAQDATSATVAMNPARTLDAILGQSAIMPGFGVTVSGGSVTTNVSFGIPQFVWLSSGSTANGESRVFTPTWNNAWSLWTAGSNNGNAWNRRRTLWIRVARTYSGSSANLFGRVLFGKTTNANATTLNGPGFGFEVRNARIWLLAHNGTSLAAVDSGVDFATSTANDFFIDSNGSGSVVLFRNGTSIATSNAGPTAASSSVCFLCYEVGNGGDAATSAFHFSPSVVSYY